MTFRFVFREVQKRLRAFALVFGAVFLCLGLEWWLRRPAYHAQAACPLLKAATDIVEGQKVDGQVAQVEFRTANGNCEAEFFTERDLDGAEWVASRPISAGAWIEKADVERGKRISLPKGRRAFSIRVESTLGIRAGDYVEVYSAASESEPFTAPVLVLESRRESAQTRSLDLVLALTQLEIRNMEKMAQRGKLSVAWIHASDAHSAPKSVRKKRSRGSRGHSARIWYDEKD